MRVVWLACFRSPSTEDFTMRFRALLIGMCLLIPGFAFSGIPGTYKVCGQNQGSTYKGTVVIERHGPIFTAVWTNEDGSIETGTGVRRGVFLSFVFKQEKDGTYGVQTYRIFEHSLQGPWVYHGASWKGYEKLKQIKSSAL